MYESILQTVGHTPLLRLKFSEKLPGNVLLKLENRNPGGSIKDRVADYCLKQALERGDIAAGGCVVAATSGNLGIGLALTAAALGLHCILTMPESMSVERRQLVGGYGAETVLTPASAGMTGAVQEAKRLAAERGGWLFDQFASEDAATAHYLSTGPEILADSGGNVDVLVSAVGSGTSLTGTGRFLKEHVQHFKAIAVEPAESPVLSGAPAGRHMIQGIGAGFVPPVLDLDLVDEILTIRGEDAVSMTRRLMREEGVCAGISTGANVAAALTVASRTAMSGKNIITFACDTGERYLSDRLFG